MALMAECPIFFKMSFFTSSYSKTGVKQYWPRKVASASDNLVLLARVWKSMLLPGERAVSNLWAPPVVVACYAGVGLRLSTFKQYNQLQGGAKLNFHFWRLRVRIPP